MRSARSLYRLHVALGAVGVLTMAIAFTVTLRAVQFTAPSLDGLMALCQRALGSGVDVDRLSLLALAGMTALVGCRAVRCAARQLRTTRRLLTHFTVVERIPATPATFVIDDPWPRAFCAGYLRPRLYLSTGARALLADAELAAVLAHEAHHARRRDPLRMLLAQTLSESLFFLPVLRRSRERFRTLAEVAADEAAIAAAGRPGPLASALLAFEARGGPASGVSPERIEHLTGERRGWDLPVRTILAGVLTLALLGAAVAAVAASTSGASFTVASVALSGCTLTLVALPVLLAGWVAGLVRWRLR